MPLPTTYSTGTASVANGATTLTIVGAVSNAIYAGDFFMDPAQPLVPPQRIASVTGGGVYELAVGWPGTAMTSGPYVVHITPDSVRVQERTRQLLEQMSVVEANGRGLFYLFATATSDADPGAGYLRLNNATPGSATAAYLDNSDANGAPVQTILDTWDDTGATGGRGQLWVRSVASPATFHAYNVTGSVVDGTGYRKLTLSYIGGSGSLVADDELMVDFVPVGPAGVNGTNGTNGTNGVDGKFSGTEVIKTAAYTALAADVGKMIILNKATADTLSFSAAATLGSTWMVMVKNIGAGTWVLDPNSSETIDGATTVSLAQNESLVVSCNGTALRTFFRGFSAFTAASAAGPAQFDLAEDTDNGTNKVSLKAPSSVASDRVVSLPDASGTVALTADIRERLTANRTYHVRTDGSDSNTGLANTSGSAFLTVQKALDVASALDFGTFDVTVQIADGTYAPGSGTSVADVRPWAGSGSLSIVGNTSTPANVVLSATAANVIAVSRGALPGKLILNGFKSQTTTSGNCITVTVPATVEHSNMNFGACAGIHINASFSAFISAQSNYSISGGGVRHWNASTFGRIDCSAKTVTITGTPAFTTFAGVVLGYLAIGSNTFSGSATGARYDASLNGIINTVGAGATYLPGNAAGATATGGQYV